VSVKSAQKAYAVISGFGSEIEVVTYDLFRLDFINRKRKDDRYGLLYPYYNFKPLKSTTLRGDSTFSIK